MGDITFGREVFLIFIGAWLVVAVVETALASGWNRTYFTAGLPLYIRRLPVSGFSFAPLDTAKLEAEFSATFTGKSLVFKELDDHLYAFREKVFEFRWVGTKNTDVMHGVLAFDLTQQQVIVKGYANWMALAVIPLLAGMGLTMGSLGWWLVPIGVIVLGIGYAFQASRFNKVAQRAAELAARQNQNDVS
jgi:hypothetical protein